MTMWSQISCPGKSTIHHPSTNRLDLMWSHSSENIEGQMHILTGGNGEIDKLCDSIGLFVCWRLMSSHVHSAALSLTKISSKKAWSNRARQIGGFPRSKGPSFTTNPNKCKKFRRENPIKMTKCALFHLPPQKNGNLYNKLQSTVTKHSNCSKAQRHSALPWWLVPLFRPIIMEESSRWSRVYPCHSSPDIDLVVSSRVWAG